MASKPTPRPALGTDPGTHPATAAIIYAFAGFLLASPLAVLVVYAVDRHPGLVAGVLVVAFQALVATLAGFWGARRNRHGREW